MLPARREVHESDEVVVRRSQSARTFWARVRDESTVDQNFKVLRADCPTPFGRQDEPSLLRKKLPPRPPPEYSPTLLRKPLPIVPPIHDDDEVVRLRRENLRLSNQIRHLLRINHELTAAAMDQVDSRP